MTIEVLRGHLLVEYMLDEPYCYWCKVGILLDIPSEHMNCNNDLDMPCYCPCGKYLP